MAVDIERGAKAFVPIHHRLQRSLHRFRRNGTTQRQDKALIVAARCFGAELYGCPHFGLRGRKGQRPHGLVGEWIEIDRDKVEVAVLDLRHHR